MVVLFSNDLFYCFDLTVQSERKIAKTIVLGKWSITVYADDLVTGWKVAKDRPIWSLDANTWKKNVVDIENNTTVLRRRLLPGENVDDDTSSGEDIDVDSGRKENNE